MDAFAQGARKARAVEALLRDETSTARAVRRERFHSAALILTLGVFAVAFLLLSHANVSSLPGAAAIALGGAMTRSTKPAGHARSGVLASLGAAPFARNKPQLNTPVFFVSVGTKEDKKNVEDSLQRMALRSGLGPVELKRLVTISKGIDASAWPDNTHLVEYAVKDVRKLASQHGAKLAELPWLQIIDLSKQTKDGKLPVEWRRLAHHVGCMYAHLFQWQLVKERGLKKALIFESDGIEHTDFPLVETQKAIDMMPKDADLLLLSFGNTHGGDLVKEWKGHGDDGTPVDVHLYKWNKFNAVAGLQSYVITDRFVRKVQAYMSHSGADMIDAWLVGKMCVNGKDKEWNMRGLGETQFMPPGSKPIINCYHATTWS